MFDLCTLRIIKVTIYGLWLMVSARKMVAVGVDKTCRCCSSNTSTRLSAWLRRALVTSTIVIIPDISTGTDKWKEEKMVG